MKQPHRRALKGRHPTRAAPTLGAIDTDRRHCFVGGNLAALVDELHVADHAARRANRRTPEEMPRLANGHLDANIQPNDPVLVPYWAFRAVYELAIGAAVDQRGVKGKARWWLQYRKDLIHGHRYALVKQALAEGRAKWFPGSPDVYEVVSQELTGTAFAAKPAGIKHSVEKVVMPALKRGQHARFYRSTSIHLYESLLNTPGPITVVPE